MIGCDPEKRTADSPKNKKYKEEEPFAQRSVFLSSWTRAQQRAHVHNELTQSHTDMFCFCLFKKIFWIFFLNRFFFNIFTTFTTTVKTRCLVISNPVIFSFFFFKLFLKEKKIEKVLNYQVRGRLSRRKAARRRRNALIRSSATQIHRVDSACCSVK